MNDAQGFVGLQFSDTFNVMPYKDPQKRKEYHAAYIKIWDKENIEKRRGYTRKHDKKRRFNPARRTAQNSSTTRKYHRERLKVLTMYGRKCVFCGESKYELLTIDHVNDNGKQHRQSPEYPSRGGIYAILSRINHDPDEYQILCYNCNIVKQRHKIYPGGETYRDWGWWEEYSKLKRRENKK